MGYTCSLVRDVPPITSYPDGSYWYAMVKELYEREANAYVDITYNYSPIFKKLMGGSLYDVFNGQKGIRSIPVFVSAIDSLQRSKHEDDWTEDEKGALDALKTMLAFAQIRPDARWNIT